MLFAKNGYFIDEKGNIVLLRGVNLAGTSKIPLKPDGTTHINQYDSFTKHKDVSFIGRPFLEEEAEEHFDRLKKWGFNFLRFLVTWESLEHGGPNIYDLEFIEYIIRMIQLAEKKGFYVFIDPHQDVWSRFTGGDGAPGWTLESIGIDIFKLSKSGLVLLHHVIGKNYKTHYWFTNYFRYPVATMFTLFFAGNDFAPNLKIDEVPIQNYLQSHFIKVYSYLAKRLSSFKNVVGFGSLNEPSAGYIGKANLNIFENSFLGKFATPTPFQEMVASTGVSIKVPSKFLIANTGIKLGHETINEHKISIWKHGYECVWKKEGVWSYDPNGAPMLLKRDYFNQINGTKVKFSSDYLNPFVREFKKQIQNVNQKFLIFIEGEPSKLELKWEEPETEPVTVINASHWYDLFLLFTKQSVSWINFHLFKHKFLLGEVKIKSMYSECISMIKEMSQKNMRNCPTVIGETGFMLDLDNGSLLKKAEYKKIDKIYDRIMSAIESNLVNVTLWNYSPDNTYAYGDRWNKENCSIYSADKKNKDDGGRGLKGFSRPYPQSTTGLPIFLEFNMETKEFNYHFQKTENKIGACIIYIPSIHFPSEIEVNTFDTGSYDYKGNEQLLYFTGNNNTDLYKIKIQRSQKQ